MRSLIAALWLLCSPAAGLVATVHSVRSPSPAAHLRVQPPRADEAAPAAAEPPAVWDPAQCDYPGCEGNGRVMGGLGAIPLFAWWPIKVR